MDDAHFEVGGLLVRRGAGKVAARVSPAPTGVSRGGSDPAAMPRSLAGARQTMLLRRTRPELSPFFEETGVYPLAVGHSIEELQQFVSLWLGPLLQYDRVHQTALCQTLRLLLDDRLVITDAAGRLHLTRQGLYHRRERITQVLGRDLGDPEIRLALSVGLRFQDVLGLETPAPITR